MNYYDRYCPFNRGSCFDNNNIAEDRQLCMFADEKEIVKRLILNILESEDKGSIIQRLAQFVSEKFPKEPDSLDDYKIELREWVGKIQQQIEDGDDRWSFERNSTREWLEKTELLEELMPGQICNLNATSIG